MHFIEEIRFLNKTCNNSVNISGSTAHDDANFFSHQQNINLQDKNRKNRVGVSPKWDINNEHLKSDNRNNSDGKINARRDIHKKNTKQIKNNHVNNSSNISPAKERSDVTTREGGNGNGNNHSKGNRKKVIILSDSMCKDLNGWDLSQKIKQNASVSLKSISGARTSCMEDYSKPSLRENPDHFILHVGTNNGTFLFITPPNLFFFSAAKMFQKQIQNQKNNYVMYLYTQSVLQVGIRQCLFVAKSRSLVGFSVVCK